MTTPKSKPVQRTRVAAKLKKEAAAKGVPRARAASAKAEAAPLSPAVGTRTIEANFETPPAVAKGPSGKLGIVVALMRRPEGATVAQMGDATGWQPHSVRGAMAGSLKRKHKLTIVGQAGEGGRVYRITAEPAA